MMKSQHFFQNPAWYQAITLTERAVSLHISQVLNSEIDFDLAEQRIHRWKTQPPFDSELLFAERLALNELNESELLYLLGRSPELMRRQSTESFTWLEQLKLAFNPTDGSVFLPEATTDYNWQQESGFLNIIEPLIRRKCAYLHQECQKLFDIYPDSPFDLSTVEELLLDGLPELLFNILGRTVVLELNCSRLQGLLLGDTPEERFESFLQRLKQPDVALTLLQEYPVLARLLTEQIDTWVTFRLEVLQRLCADWEEIKNTFSNEQKPGTLVEFQAGAGDSHRGGRSVTILKFSSGLRIVYKPKALAVDLHFQELLAWLNERGNHPPLQTLKILNRGTYGWVEFVEASGCTSTAEIKRFYERQGCYLALLYALEASDFHDENLIAAGEHPVLIDLETLFQPRFNESKPQQNEKHVFNFYQDTVLRVGMLPERILSNAEFEGIETSGLGGASDQFWPYRNLHLEGLGTDEIRLVRKQIKLSEGLNRPTIDNVKIDALQYIDDIIVGFTAMYQQLIHSSEELLSETSPLACFAEDEIRIVLRPTHTYEYLLFESFHPDLLRNALDRDLFFDKLWLDVKHFPKLAKVIKAEQKALWDGDIPMFTSSPNSCDLWSSSTEKVINFFDCSGMAQVRQRLQQLNEQDLAKQLWIIRASLAILSPPSTQLLAHPANFSLTETQNYNDSKQLHKHLIAASRTIGDRLEKLALFDEHSTTWLGLNSINEKYWQVMPLGTSLYDGIPGVCLFLSYLGVILQDERYTALANTALTTLERQLEDNRSIIKSIGGFDGWGGIIYTFLHLGVLWNRADLLSKAEKLVEQLPTLIEQDEELDIIGGAAGCLSSLLCLYRYTQSEQVLTTAIQCGDHLIDTAKPMKQGIGWMKKEEKNPWSGFSHGAAGIAWALLELAAITGEERFHSTAIAGIEYERSLFVPQAGNWADLRNFTESILTSNKKQHECMTAWCHGAPGIGLARLLSLPYLDDAKIRDEIDIALKNTLDQGFNSNHSLCHGDLGNLELLLQTSMTFGDSKWHSKLNRLTAQILESIDRQGWICAVPLSIETPGLMTGLAGIGYELLRLAEPTRVPSVLTLESPKLESIQ
jgi:type 2 lantibiotic biosynthesis protein LanM